MTERCRNPSSEVLDVESITVISPTIKDRCKECLNNFLHLFTLLSHLILRVTFTVVISARRDVDRSKYWDRVEIDNEMRSESGGVILISVDEKGLRRIVTRPLFLLYVYVSMKICYFIKKRDYNHWNLLQIPLKIHFLSPMF